MAVASGAESYAQFAGQAGSFEFASFFNTKTELAISQEGFYINGQLIATFSSASFTSIYPYYIFTTRNDSSLDTRMMVGKCYAFSVERSGALMLRLIPALRNADGVPGMFDRVSKQFFENAGTGTFGYRIKTTGDVVAPTTYSLRDPHRVAPSGVWARLAADGTLDAVAETELEAEQATAQGYAYFANTADAAEVLGATEQETV